MSTTLILDALRELTPEEMSAPQAPRTNVRRLTELHSLHHMQAQLLAQGKSPGDVASALGTSVGRIRTLLEDPMFQELMEYYKTQNEVLWLENQKKAAIVGRLAMDLLQEKLEKTPVEELAVRELKEVAAEMGDRSDFPKRDKSVVQVAPPVITFNFGQLRGEGKVIEGETEE